MTQWFKLITALAEDLGLFPIIHIQLTTIYNFSSRKSEFSSEIYTLLHLCGSHTHTHKEK